MRSLPAGWRLIQLTEYQPYKMASTPAPIESQSALLVDIEDPPHQGLFVRLISELFSKSIGAGFLSAVPAENPGDPQKKARNYSTNDVLSLFLTAVFFKTTYCGRP